MQLYLPGPGLREGHGLQSGPCLHSSRVCLTDYRHRDDREDVRRREQRRLQLGGRGGGHGDGDGRDMPAVNEDKQRRTLRVTWVTRTNRPTDPSQRKFNRDNGRNKNTFTRLRLLIRNR